jgi:hypothetical protein
MRERWRPLLVRGLLAVGRQVGRRRIRVALFGAVEFADLSDTDFRGAKDASGERRRETLHAGTQQFRSGQTGEQALDH